MPTVRGGSLPWTYAGKVRHPDLDSRPHSTTFLPTCPVYVRPVACYITTVVLLLRDMGMWLAHLIALRLQLRVTQVPGCSGTVGEVVWPTVQGLRVDTWIVAGTEVTPNYDSLLAKVMVHGSSREEALARMAEAVERMRVKGIPTNAQLLECILSSKLFGGSQYDTTLMSHLDLKPSFVEVCSLTDHAHPPGCAVCNRQGVEACHHATSYVMHPGTPGLCTFHSHASTG